MSLTARDAMTPQVTTVHQDTRATDLIKMFRESHFTGIPVVDDNQTAIDLIRSLSNEDFPGTAPVIAKDGSFGPRAPAP